MSNARDYFWNYSAHERWNSSHESGLGVRWNIWRFSYRTHHEFYPDYCEIEDIDPVSLEGTTRIRFEHILKTEAPVRQALILRGVLKKFQTLRTRHARLSTAYECRT